MAELPSAATSLCVCMYLCICSKISVKTWLDVLARVWLRIQACMHVRYVCMQASMLAARYRSLAASQLNSSILIVENAHVCFCDVCVSTIMFSVQIVKKHQMYVVSYSYFGV